MRFVEIIIAFGLMLVSWVGAEVTARFGDHQDTYFAYVINAADDPIITRTGAGYDYHRAGLIYGGTFQIIAHSIFADDKTEWAIIRVSPFSLQEVFIPVDLTRMSTTWVRQGRIFSLGIDKIMTRK